MIVRNKNTGDGFLSDEGYTNDRILDKELIMQDVKSTPDLKHVLILRKH